MYGGSNWATDTYCPSDLHLIGGPGSSSSSSRNGWADSGSVADDRDKMRDGLMAGERAKQRAVGSCAMTATILLGRMYQRQTHSAGDMEKTTNGAGVKHPHGVGRLLAAQ